MTALAQALLDDLQIVGNAGNAVGGKDKADAIATAGNPPAKQDFTAVERVIAIAPLVENAIIVGDAQTRFVKREFGGDAFPLIGVGGIAFQLPGTLHDLFVVLENVVLRIVECVGRHGMAARVTPEELILMHQLYNKYHSYARVAREIGRSASCVSYNIKMKHAPKVVKDTFPGTVRK